MEDSSISPSSPSSPATKTSKRKGIPQRRVPKAGTLDAQVRDDQPEVQEKPSPKKREQTHENIASKLPASPSPPIVKPPSSPLVIPASPPASPKKPIAARSPKRRSPSFSNGDGRQSPASPASPASRRRRLEETVKEHHRQHTAKHPVDNEELKGDHADKKSSKLVPPQRESVSAKEATSLESSQSFDDASQDDNNFNALSPFLGSPGGLTRTKSLHAKVEHRPLRAQLGKNNNLPKRDHLPLSPGRSPFAAHIDFAHPLSKRSPPKRTLEEEPADVPAESRNLARQRLTAGKFIDNDEDTREFVVVPPSSSPNRRPAKHISSKSLSSLTSLSSSQESSQDSVQDEKLTEHQRDFHPNESFYLDN